MQRAHRRQYERRPVDLPVQLSIAESARAQVAPVAGSVVPGRMKNMGGGGALVETSTFLPRATYVDLEIPETPGTPAGSIRARVMSARMVDREPHYGLGLRFEDPDNPLVGRLRAGDEGQNA